MSADTDTVGPPRRLLTASILSIGSELTVGDTRDTNAGEVARSLTAHGVAVRRLTALPDGLDDVRDAFLGGLELADLVVSTGGLGPTPDDLTREAIAAACGEDPHADPAMEAWLRGLWRRRGLPFPDINLKQAWIIPSADALPNPNGTAPGWFVTRPDGRCVVALPGPPREMRPMWTEHALPRLRAIGLGTDVAARTYRLTGIGESQVAERLGEDLLRVSNPVVATYARVEAVDVRISATGDGTTAATTLVEAAAAVVIAELGEFVWATDDTTWSMAIGARLAELGWSLSIVEIATAGQVAALVGDVPWLRFDESLAPDAPGALSHGPTPDDTDDDRTRAVLAAYARGARELGGSDVGLAVAAIPFGGDTITRVAVVTPTATHHGRRVAFLDGANGRSRAALAAAAILLEALRGDGP